MIYAALAHLFAVMSPGPDTAIIIREVSLNKKRGIILCIWDWSWDINSLLLGNIWHINSFTFK